jgi:hypothetical protein
VQDVHGRLTAWIGARSRRPAAEPRPACAPGFILHEDTQAVWDTVEIHGSGADCSMAKETARRWRDEPACRTLQTGDACRAGAMLCTAIERGAIDPSAVASCGADGVAPIELVGLQGCQAPIDLTVGSAR